MTERRTLAKSLLTVNRVYRSLSQDNEKRASFMGKNKQEGEVTLPKSPFSFLRAGRDIRVINPSCAHRGEPFRENCRFYGPKEKTKVLWSQKPEIHVVFMRMRLKSRNARVIRCHTGENPSDASFMGRGKKNRRRRSPQRCSR